MSKYLMEYRDWAASQSLLISEGIHHTIGVRQSEIESLQSKIKAWFSRKLDLDVFFIGGAGKKKTKEELSYNLDLGIDLSAFLTKRKIKEKDLQKELSMIFEKEDIDYEYKNSEHLFYYPVEDKYLECKMFFAPAPAWLSFSRFSPDLSKKQSQFTNHHRNLLIKSIAENSKKKIISYFENGERIKEYEVYEFDELEGLLSTIRTFEGRNGILIKGEKKPEKTRVVTRSVDDFIHEFFSSGVKEKDLRSFEKVYELVVSERFKFVKKHRRILKDFVSRLKSRELAIPDVCKKFLD